MGTLLKIKLTPLRNRSICQPFPRLKNVLTLYKDGAVSKFDLKRNADLSHVHYSIKTLGKFLDINFALYFIYR